MQLISAQNITLQKDKIKIEMVGPLLAYPGSFCCTAFAHVAIPQLKSRRGTGKSIDGDTVVCLASFPIFVSDLAPSERRHAD